MADGGRYDPATSIAASSTCRSDPPRGDLLRNGQTALVRVRDRVPGTNGRILNVSAKVAEFLGVRRGGVFPVTVAPLAVPQADGGIRLAREPALLDAALMSPAATAGDRLPPADLLVKAGAALIALR